MQIGVLGINHKSAELKVREAVATACRKLFPQKNAILLTTCNRTEVYFSGEDLIHFHTEILHQLQREISFSFEHALYVYFGRDCFLHLACVTAGLDSIVIGECDIQRQVKNAYIQAASLQKLSSSLHFLFQKCLKIGKWTRSHEPIFKMHVSLEQIIYRLVTTIFSSSFSVLFIGNSEINRKIIDFFIWRGLRKLSLSTRLPHAAEAFALDRGISLGDRTLLSRWEEFDLVISGTNNEGYVIHSIQNTLKTRLILDLCVPRSVHPDMNRHSSLTLLNMEKLGNLAVETRHNQWREVHQAKEKIAEAVNKQVISYQKKTGVVSTVVAYVP